MEVNKQSIWISATTETTANCQKKKIELSDRRWSTKSL